MDLSISIIIPVYNVEKYVRRCIESVMTQDTAGADVECIIVNDCTPDNSMDIANEMTSSYQGSIRFIVLQHKENKGLSAARNTGTAQAKGNYILYIDSDDWLLPDSISYFVEYINKYPFADVITAEHITDDSEHPEVPLGADDFRLIQNDSNVLKLLLQDKLHVHAWNKLVRREFLVGKGIKFIDGIIHEDIAWSYQLFSKAEKVLLLPRATYKYESVPTSIMNSERQTNNARKGILGYATSIEDILKSPPSDDFGYRLHTTSCTLPHVVQRLTLERSYGRRRHQAVSEGETLVAMFHPPEPQIPVLPLSAAALRPLPLPAKAEHLPQELLLSGKTVQPNWPSDRLFASKSTILR